MRLLYLTILTVLAVVHYGSCASNKKLSSQSMLGQALLRRALEAMSNSPRIHVNRRSLDDEEESGEGIKHTDAVEDIFVGSGSRSEERGESSGERRSEVNEEQTVGSEGQSDVSENSAESSGDDGTQTDEPTQEGGTVEASGQEKAGKTDDQQEDNGVSSGSDTVETASDTQTTSSANSSSETSPSDDAESGNEPVQGTESNNDKTSPAESTVQAAKSEDQTKQEPKKNAGEQEADTKKSTIPKPKVTLSLVAVKEDAESSASSGESDEVTSDTETTSGESSGVEEDGSAEAIRKGMESLSKLLKPVANGVDFQLFSGAAKPEDDEEEDEEEEKPVSKAEGKGESDKAEENEEEKPKVVKVKKCETKCALPMTYDQCAVPRCGYKMGTIKDLCIYLCKHQKPVCKQECKEVE